MRRVFLTLAAVLALALPAAAQQRVCTAQGCYYLPAQPVYRPAPTVPQLQPHYRPAPRPAYRSAYRPTYRPAYRVQGGCPNGQCAVPAYSWPGYSYAR